jgi:ribosomal protein L11 methyltransferase
MRSYKPYVEFRLTESRIRLKTPDGENRIVEISPGCSFGAEHPTTRLCITALEEIFNKRAVKTVLDFGCGSGVLGICAASLGGGGVLAVDIDPAAVKEAKANFERNKLNSIGQVRYGSTEEVRGRFELIIANIVTDDLLTLVDWFKSVLSEGGILLVSGVYEVKERALVTAYAKADFTVINRYRESGWLAICFETE